jgi:hypothetical protein
MVTALWLSGVQLAAATEAGGQRERFRKNLGESLVRLKTKGLEPPTPLLAQGRGGRVELIFRST